ncbi:MAG: TIGR04255 family protein [Blastocatellia bacterium]|nr:TIGR04255 family protein [Blastocatellia bacterium]
MPFPKVERVLYKRNPLDQVICQLRFPPILRIDAEIPANFQDKVRTLFPNFLETSQWNVEVSPNLKGQIPFDIVQQVLQSSGNKNYEFSSEDGQWKINLTRNFVALTTKKYERWEEFKEKLQVPLEALINIYTPDYFSRVGLRYMDIIKRSALNLGDVSWDKLLQPYILGILGCQEVGSYVKDFENKYEVELSDGQSFVRIITKFAEALEDREICYMIDSDFYNSQKTKIDSVVEKLDYLNTRASRLIQWCITGQLHDAMEPRKL